MPDRVTQRPTTTTPTSSAANDAPAQPLATATVAQLREAAADPSLTSALKQALDAALLSADSGTAPRISLAFLDSLGPEGAALKARLAPPASTSEQPADSTWTPRAPASTTTTRPPQGDGFQDSLFNRAGRGNISGTNSALTRLPGLTLGNADLGRVHLDDSNAIKNPDSVMTQGSAVQAIKNIVGSGNPKAAEQVAAELASRYGAFTAQNSPENRAAILDALTWIADTNQGLRYDTPRSQGTDATTQSPNQTLAMRSGVCRDIHTATAAILASLVNAHPDASGKIVPGSPDGREADVQAISFNNPTEYHDFMVFRDPATNRWNSLEYSKRYSLNAATAVDAMRQTTGSLSGFSRYTLNGWDGKPVINNKGTVNAERSNAFFNEDAGVGSKGEVRVTGGADDLKVTGFLTNNLSLTGGVSPQDLGNGLRGGIKVNFHTDFENADTRGYLRVAGGITTDFADSSVYTGLRGENDRARFQTYVLGVKVDSRLEGKERELLREHLKATWGVDVDLLAGVPFATGNGATVLMPGAIGDYSKANLGADGGLSGHEQLSKNLALDWAVRARAQVDAINLATELVTSEGGSAKRSLIKDPGRAEIAIALTHKADNGLLTRFEAGGTTLLAAPYDDETLAREVHHAVLTVSPQSGLVNFALVAKGETIDKKIIPVDALGIAVNVNPRSNVQVGLGASSVFPGGDLRTFGKNVQVTGSVAIRF